MGDVDVVWHDGVYHLFHLILPNHVFIAHAVSCDGINWERTDNALFIGNPGTWDDLMLWTMHVSADPHHAETWRMFYTGYRDLMEAPYSGLESHGARISFTGPK